VISVFHALALAVVAVPVAAGAATQLVRSARAVDRVAAVGALASAGVGVALVLVTLLRLDEPLRTGLVTVDAASAVFLVPIIIVGTTSALLSPSYLNDSKRSFFPAARARRLYYLAFFWFWAALLAVPIAGNLGEAWLFVEATTAASAMLVAYSGGRHALEAGWKYLVLTTAGLTVALTGIVIVYVAAPAAHHNLGGLDWTTLSATSHEVPHRTALAAFVLIIVGLAAKIGWAPVHNWLPDAHSEAPPPVSALLSAALLPAVVLVAWRTTRALEPAVGNATTHNLLIGFGLLSLAVAVPFLWRPLAFKRLLAYSSLEHMGVIALGIGFGSRLALAGGRDPRHRPRACEGSRFLRRDPSAPTSASCDQPSRSWPRAARHRRRKRTRHQPDLTERPPPVAALLQRAVRRARRLRRRPHDYGLARRGAPCPRFSRSHSRIDRGDGGTLGSPIRRADSGSADCAGHDRLSDRSDRPCRRRDDGPSLRNCRSVGAVGGMNAATYTADAPELRTVDATDWRDAVSEALASGRRFTSLHALDETGNATVRALFGGAQPLLLSCRSVDATVPSIIDIVPAAIWDEREAHDLYGVGFDGHTPLRPLVNHSATLDDWVVPVHGHNPYDVAVGPIHAGVIESGHFRFHVVGERILQLDLRLFYKHRGLEKAAEGVNDHEAIRHVGRACAADHVAHTIAYAQAIESARGLWPSVGLSDARTFRRRARTRLEPSERHRRDLCRHRLRRRQHGLRRAERTRPEAQRRPVRAPVPVRHGRRRGQPVLSRQNQP